MPKSTARTSSAVITAARVWFNNALARNEELPAADRQRLVYLEQRSSEDRNVSQDLFHKANNALFIMEMDIELLKCHVAGECEHKEVATWLAILKDKIEEIKAVNGELFAKAGDGPIYIIHSFVSFRSVIERVLAVYQDAARKKRIRISWTVPGFPSIAIWSDAIAIGTVLDNLLSNAIKFSDTGKRIEVTLRRDENELICTVRDEGPGLSKSDQSKLFQRGASLGPKPTGGETSNGLAASRTLVRRLGGRLWCESIEGKGTCFMFSLPVEERRKTPRSKRG
jgi:signal transduction histidine kinase